MRIIDSLVLGLIFPVAKARYTSALERQRRASSKSASGCMLNIFEHEALRPGSYSGQSRAGLAGRQAGHQSGLLNIATSSYATVAKKPVMRPKPMSVAGSPNMASICGNTLPPKITPLSIPPEKHAVCGHETRAITLPRNIILISSTASSLAMSRHLAGRLGAVQDEVWVRARRPLPASPWRLRIYR
jgi:hypothetical protein